MQIYLPIAEMAVNPLLLAALGVLVGAMSGLFGVGGGFLMTPLLILIGVPAPVAVATGANVAAASGMSGLLSHWARRAVDLRLGLVLLIGGVAGSVFGVQALAALTQAGLAESVITLGYVLLLGFLGGAMCLDSLRAWRRARTGDSAAPLRRRHGLAHALPLRMRFPASKLYLSVAPPILIGFGVGMLSAILGVGGGFVLIPALIYLLNMPMSTVVGTSLLQVVVVAAFATLLQAAVNQTVDLVLAALLITGGVIGAQIGSLAGRRLQGDQTRALLGALVVGVALALLLQVAVRPDDVYTLSAR